MHAMKQKSAWPWGATCTDSAGKTPSLHDNQVGTECKGVKPGERFPGRGNSSCKPHGNEMNLKLGLHKQKNVSSVARA